MRRAILATVIAGASAGGAVGAALTPSAGAIIFSGTLDRGGTYVVQADLQGGNLNGKARLTLDGQTLEAPLKPGHSYLENGKCYLRFEQGRARAEIRGPCTDTAIDGSFETFLPGMGIVTGKASGKVTLAGGAPPVARNAEGQVPKARLTCAYQDRKYTAKLGETTQYSLAYSNMVNLTLTASGYTAGKSSGSYQRVAQDKIQLTSGPWRGAIGTLEPDRSGRPAVVFHIEENRHGNGVHIVDPYTTRCTEARQ